MKQVVFDEVNKIHWADVDRCDIILVRKAGKAFGTVVYNNSAWSANSANIGHDTFDVLSDACRWFGAYCEFYVFE